MSFVEEQFERREEVTASEIGDELKQHLGVVFHPRTVEKLIKELRSKKNS
jgi:transposase